MSVSRRAFGSTLVGTALLRTGNAAPATAEPTHPSTAAEWRPHFFDNHQLDTVSALADLIIPNTDTPGAREARVHQHLDEILFASPQRVQTTFLEGLSWLDGYCLRTQRKPFTQFAPGDQMKTLEYLLDASEADLKPGSEFVRLVKQWTARVYYSTEAGQQELNKGGRVPHSYISVCDV